MLGADDPDRFAAAAWIDPTARVFGAVTIGEGSSLWPYAVIRSESKQVAIGRFSNVQDHAMFQIGYATSTIVVRPTTGAPTG